MRDGSGKSGARWLQLSLLLGASVGFASGQTTKRVDVETDTLFSGDVDVIQSRLRYEQEWESWTVAGTFGHIRHEIEYRSTDTFPSEVSREEDTWEGGIEVEKAFGDRFALLGAATYTEGFPDHRQLWISQFYDLDNAGQPAYESADPRSLAFSLGGQWNYRPGYAFLQATVSFSRADIVPGWLGQVNPATGSLLLESTEETLDTYTGSLIWSTVVNPRLRTQQTFRISQVEGREVRTQLRSEWAYSATDWLAFRGEIGAAHENPIFEAIYGGLTAVIDLNESWQFTAGARYYEDTGEVSVSDFTPSAPGLDSWELSAGVRWQRADLQVRLSGALLDSDFDPVDLANQPFSFLYRDRQFAAARLAITYQF